MFEFSSDVGSIIFQDLLGMTQYPGAPFTGEIFRDLIMFLIIPTVFIILILYTMTGRIVDDSRLRLMIGVAAYLFIIASGYYGAFALLAGPYFIFLILVLGVVYYLKGHFRSSSGGDRAGGGGGGHFSHSYGGGYAENNFSGMGRRELAEERKRVEAMLSDIEHEIKEAQDSKEQSRLETLRERRVGLKDNLRIIEHQLKIIKL